ncbi:MAG: dihydroorotase [Ignavibacterium sp.]|nr:dihydroorotase [Ignavibacterium sp.]MCX7611220.1 dihydroorotase [Ignavibacterium sp.]MDW8375779.1 dihydroorotase [Ignavibacteriales bacterium]
MKYLFKNTTIINPEQQLSLKDFDILISDGLIIKIGQNLEYDNSNTKVIELKGKILVPGFLDMHVHLREPGREDEETIETGSRAAANGGFTAVACMPNTEPSIDSAEVIELIKNKSKSFIVDVYPVAAATIERKGEFLSPMLELKEAGAVAFSDDGVAIKTASILKRAMEYSKMIDLPIIEHCEDESLSNGSMNEGINSTLFGLLPLPSVSEDIIVMRDILMAQYTGARVHIAHISSANAVKLVREAKKKGIKVTAEVTPHHFTLTDDLLKTYDTNLKMNPPLRTHQDVQEILEGLKDGTIDCIASDHAPHSIEEKELEFDYAPNGVVGLETSVGIALSELFHKKVLSIEEIIMKYSINPRKILNIPIPSFAEGSKAEFTILDLNEVWTVDKEKFLSKSKNTPFDKRLLTGKPLGIFNKGKLFLNGEII